MNKNIAFYGNTLKTHITLNILTILYPLIIIDKKKSYAILLV